MSLDLDVQTDDSNYGKCIKKLAKAIGDLEQMVLSLERQVNRHDRSFSHHIPIGPDPDYVDEKVRDRQAKMLERICKGISDARQVTVDFQA